MIWMWKNAANRLICNTKLHLCNYWRNNNFNCLYWTNNLRFSLFLSSKFADFPCYVNHYPNLGAGIVPRYVNSGPYLKIRRWIQILLRIGDCHITVPQREHRTACCQEHVRINTKNKDLFCVWGGHYDQALRFPQLRKRSRVRTSWLAC